MLVLDESHEENWSVISVSGDFDVVGAPQVRSAIMRTIAAGATGLIIDLSRVDFVDSFGLGVLVGALKRVAAAAGQLVLVLTEPRVLKVFEITGLDSVFVIAASLAEAKER